MAFAVELLLIVVTTLIAYVFWSRQKPKNFPPGPTGLPIFGCALNLGQSSHRYFRDLSKKYASSVISVKLGTRDVVVLNDWKCIQDALLRQAEVFSGRPSMFIWNETMTHKGVLADIVTTQGPQWKERKRFTLQHLREMGFGKHSMEEIIMEEVKKTIGFIEDSTKDRIDITHLFFTPIFSILNRIMEGRTYEVGDEAMIKLSEAIKFNFECFKNDSPLNFMAYLRHIPGMTNFTEFMASHKNVEKLLQRAIDEHLETYVQGNTRDFIDIFLREVFKNKDKNPAENAFKQENLLGLMYNLYNAGVETTAHSLAFSLLYTATWPEIQSKVQTELDQLLGNGRLPTYSDRKLLPYTEATILEILRYSTTLPLSLPHAPVTDAQLDGYTIPKGTFMLQNIWAVHYDAHLWGDPEVFRPERFLDENGQVQRPEYLIPFSLGARFCPGESLARMELFLFFASLMQRFSFRCITGEVPPSLEPIVGVTQRSQPFSLVIKIRE